MIASNALTGCVAGILLLQIVRRERERRAVIRERLQIVSEMNHHIRNALQVISFFVSKEKDQETVEMVRSSVDRIQWALKRGSSRRSGDPEGNLACSTIEGRQLS